MALTERESSASTAPIVFLGKQPGSCWVLVAGWMPTASTPLTDAGGTTVAQSLTKNLIYGVVGGLIVVTGVFYNRDLPLKWFGQRIADNAWADLRRIFALHLAVLHFVMWSTGWQLFEGRLPQIWALTVVISIVVAEVVYRLGPAPRQLQHLRPRGHPGPGVPAPPQQRHQGHRQRHQHQVVRPPVVASRGRPRCHRVVDGSDQAQRARDERDCVGDTGAGQPPRGRCDHESDGDAGPPRR